MREAETIIIFGFENELLYSLYSIHLVLDFGFTYVHINGERNYSWKLFAGKFCCSRKKYNQFSKIISNSKFKVKIKGKSFLLDTYGI
jgi:hypothetical protein